MRSKHLLLLAVFAAPLIVLSQTPGKSWIGEKHNGYRLLYQASDKKNIPVYVKFVDQGITSVETFFKESFKKEFDIYIHPSRHSLDSTWQKDWNMPEFKSECWMVASGIASKLDVISPQMWDKTACDHKYSETEKTQKVITHELVHVYHGQQNISPDFSNTEGIDWFVEGLATYASGQCDPSRIADVKQAVVNNKIPESLAKFWTGNLKYGLSGSVVMYIDKKYGRGKLNALLPLNKNSEILMVLNTTESELLAGWRKFIQE